MSLMTRSANLYRIRVRIMNINTDKACFFTGHRIIPAAHRAILINDIRLAAQRLITEHNVTDFIAGGARGFDTLAATQILRLRGKFADIRLHLYLPCRDQAKLWTRTERETWQNIAENADDVLYVTDGDYVTGCMQKRNKAVVRDAAYGIVYLTHGRSGTYQTTAYAQELGRQLIRLPLT